MQIPAMTEMSPVVDKRILGLGMTGESGLATSWSSKATSGDSCKRAKNVATVLPMGGDLVDALRADERASLQDQRVMKPPLVDAY